MSGIEIDWKPIAKWGAIGGVSTLGVYLACRWLSSRRRAEEMAKIGEYRNVCAIKKDLMDRYLGGEITKEKYQTVEEQKEKEAKRLEEEMKTWGISEDVIRAITYAIFGVPAITAEIAAGIYLIRRIQNRRPPRGPTIVDKSIDAYETSKISPPTEEEKATRTREVQEKIAGILHTSGGWVKSHWMEILMVLILMGVGYALVQAVGAAAVPDEPAWVVGFTFAVRRFVGVPPPVV
jgi:hypothetical protein